MLQRDRDTDNVYLGYSSPKTPSRVYLYNLSNNKSLIKELINDLSKEHNSVLGELNNYKDQNKLLNKVIEKLESYNTLLTNKITDIENNNKILTDIIDENK